MSTITYEVLFIFILIIANGVFAMTEAAVISSRKERLRQWANEGNDGARTVLELANDPTRFLSTVQFGITLVGELVPKRLALNNPERIAAALIKPMRFLARAASPAVSFLSHSTNAVLRVLGMKPSTEPPVTEDEIKIRIEQGKQAGVFEKTEQDMVERIFQLSDRRVYTLMTQRADIIWLEVNDPLAAIQEKAASGRSRFPVCEGSLDHILGVVKMKDLLARSLAGQPLELKSALRQPLYVPESMRAFKVLEQFKQSRTSHYCAKVLAATRGARWKKRWAALKRISPPTCKAGPKASRCLAAAANSRSSCRCSFACRCRTGSPSMKFPMSIISSS